MQGLLYIKKPIPVAAVQWRRGVEIEGVVEGRFEDAGHVFPAKCKTLEGWHGVREGDYIITGVRGEKYPCEESIFQETYEPARG